MRSARFSCRLMLCDCSNSGCSKSHMRRSCSPRCAGKFQFLLITAVEEPLGRTLVEGHAEHPAIAMGNFPPIKVRRSPILQLDFARLRHANLPPRASPYARGH